MEYTKDQVKEAILTIADKWGCKENYEAMINNSNGSLPEAVKDIVYFIFVRTPIKDRMIDHFYEPETEKAYKIIHSFVMELDEKGFVEYNK